MSIYCTTLDFSDEFPDDDDYIGPPYVYQGSHIEPATDHPRDGRLDIGAIPDHIGPCWDQFLRLGVAETADAMDNEPGAATVLLDRQQVTELRDYLTAWLEREPTEDNWTLGEVPVTEELLQRIRDRAAALQDSEGATEASPVPASRLRSGPERRETT